MPFSRGIAVGRTVHYVSYGTPGGEYKPGKHRAAIITAVYSRNGEMGSDPSGPDDISSTIGICVLNPTGAFFHEFCPYDAEARAGSWHWPEFVQPIVKMGDKVKFVLPEGICPGIVINADAHIENEGLSYEGQSIAVFSDTSGLVIVIAQYSENKEEGTWHW
mgnify:FL=1